MNGSFGETLFFFIIIIWSLIVRGIALWKAAKQAQRNWFIVLLILNTAGILDLIYLFRFSKKRMTLQEVKTGFKDIFFSKTKK